MLDVLFQQVPWLPQVLSWSVACMLIWVIAAIPALLLLRVVEVFQQRLNSFTTRVSGFWTEQRMRSAERRALARQQVLEDHALTRAVESAEGRLRSSLEELKTPLDVLTTVLSSARKGIDRASESLKTLGDIASMRESLPKANGDDVIYEKAWRARLARVNLVVGWLLLASCVLVNTGMLSQILRDLEIIPPDYVFAGVPLTYVFAGLLTLVEAGMGFLYGVLSEDDGTGRHLRGGAIVSLLGAAGIAFVEGFFYSRIGSGSTGTGLHFQVPIPGIDAKVSFETIFFIWGFVLVMALFGFGLVCHRAGTTLVKSGSARALMRSLRGLAKAEDVWRENLSESQQTLKATTTEAESVKRTFESYADQLKGIRGTVAELAGALRGEALEVRALTPGEARQLEYRASFWLCTLIAAGAALIILSPWRFIASIAAVSCVAVGVFIGTRIEALRSHRRQLGRLVVIGVCAAAVAMTVLGWLFGIRIVATVAGALVLAVSGFELAGVLAFVGLHLAGLSGTLLTCLGLVAIAVLWALQAILNIVEYVLTVIAAPIMVVVRRLSWA